MKLYSTNNKNNIVSLKEAVLNALPIDKGLYMPLSIPKLPPSFFKSLKNYSFNKIAFEVSSHLFDKYIPSKDLEDLIERAFNFDAPLIGLGNDIFSLELYHGPTLAFKDFGARYMAQLIKYFNKKSDKKVTILVATSGDTGGAVASGFHKTEGIDVIILYPSGKVSPLQEKQITTWGDNITALEIQGSFDDCQNMVKNAFLDHDLKTKYNLSSANSINIARLIPQSFYYFRALAQLETKKQIVVSVPSGNFGNITAGLMASKMGLQIDKFIAATNSNNAVPLYLESGEYMPKPSINTLSNAMDVGNPSNFPRLHAIFGSTWNIVKNHIDGYHLNDIETKSAMREATNEYAYTCDPHGAIAYKSIVEYMKKENNIAGIFLETAHPSKFLEVVETAIGREVGIPDRLKSFASLKKESIQFENSYDALKSYLLSK